MNDTDTELELRRKKLQWRAEHRGMKEMDLLLGRFVALKIAGLDKAGLDLLEEIINTEDPALYGWLIHKEPLPKGHGNYLLDELMAMDYTGSGKKTL